MTGVTAVVGDVIASYRQGPVGAEKQGFDGFDVNRGIRYFRRSRCWSGNKIKRESPNSWVETHSLSDSLARRAASDVDL
jgi:hypothetical protein